MPSRVWGLYSRVGNAELFTHKAVLVPALGGLECWDCSGNSTRDGRNCIANAVFRELSICILVSPF